MSCADDSSIVLDDLHNDVDLIESSPILNKKANKVVIQRTIARTPVLKNHFPKLALKKNINSCPLKSFTTDNKKQDHPIEVHNENSTESSSSSMHNIYISTPPFVTKNRPVPRKLSSLLFSSSCNSSGESKLSDSKFFDNHLPTVHSTPTLENKIISPHEPSSGKADNASSDDAKCADIDIDQGMAKLMDDIYGDIWRSTPGLFEKKKKRKPMLQNDDSFRELLNRISSINLSGNEDEKSDREKNLDDSVILLDSFNKSIDKNNEKDSNKCDFINKHEEIEKELNVSCDDLLVFENNNANILRELNHEIFFIDSNENKDERINNDKPLSNILDANNKINLNSKELKNYDKPTKEIFNKENVDIKTKKNIKKKDENAFKVVGKDDKILETPLKKINKKDQSSTQKPSAKNDTELENIQLYSFMASLSENVPSWRMDYKAKHYRDNFKKKKEELTSILFKMFNENVFGSKISSKLPIKWSTSLNKTAGRAHNKMVKSKNELGETISTRRSHIELSVKVVDTVSRLRNTLAHELCHVATWLIDGQLHDGHGPYWKMWVNKMLKRYPELVSIPVCHTYDIHFKYSYKCMKCGYKINRHSKSIDTTKKRCGYCYGTFECILNKKTKDGLIVSTPSKQRNVVNGFALYVKENYSNARSGSTPHKDVMKYLGNQYAKLKSQSQDPMK